MAHSQSVCTTGSGLGQDTMSSSPKRMPSCRVVPERLINGIDKFIEGIPRRSAFVSAGLRPH